MELLIVAISKISLKNNPPSMLEETKVQDSKLWNKRSIAQLCN